MVRSDRYRIGGVPGRYVEVDETSIGGRTRGESRGAPDRIKDYLAVVRLVFTNLKSWLNGVHHGVSNRHLQAYLKEFAFCFNKRLCPFNAIPSLLWLAGQPKAPTFAALYSEE